MSDFGGVRRRDTLRVLAGLAGASALPRAAFAFDPTPDGFRDEVIAIARGRYPTFAPLLKPGPGKTDLIWGDHHLYIDNLYLGVRELPPDKRELAIIDWLAALSPEAQAKMEAAKKNTDDWGRAKALLRPKFQPKRTATSFKRLVHQPFSAGLVIAYAIDLGDKDLYVVAEKLAKWSVPLSEVHDNAIANLESMSASLPLAPKHLEHTVGSFLVVETGDGYDAARLLLPAFRSRLLTAMGPTLRAGVPARDALVVWSTDFSARDFVEGKVSRYATEMPHALSGEIFAFDATGVRLASDNR